jgi:hypothetical protein
VKKHLFWLIPFFALAVAVLVIYFPAFSFEFIQWDDDYNIYENPYFRADQFWPFWEAPYMGLYIPFVYTVWSFLYHLGETADPMIFHAFNIALHFLNSILVFWLIRKILTNFESDENKIRWSALVGALLFAIHPLQIGAVAWVSGGRDLMCGFLALMSLIYYFDRKSWYDYFFSFVFFAFALFCKPGIVSLPVVFLLSDWILKRKFYSSFPFFISVLVLVEDSFHLFVLEPGLFGFAL